MKLYEILNEEYLGRKFKLIKDGIESEWVRSVRKNSAGRYGYEMDHSRIWNLSECNLLCEVELIETPEDIYNRYYNKPVVIKNQKNEVGSFSIDISPYNELKYAKEHSLLSIMIKEYDEELFVYLSFEQLQALYDRGVEIRKVFNKIKQNK